MNGLWRWRHRPADLEAELRAIRPEPRPEFVRAVAGQIREATTSRRSRILVRPRLALAGALTASMLAAVAGFGGFGYAATAARQALSEVQQLIAVNDAPDAIVVGGLSSDGDQYQPGYGWGDPNHNHEGPPGLTRQGGESATSLQVLCRSDTATALARVRLVLDEQADLRVSVLGPRGRRLPLTPATGGQPTKTLEYRILIPRAFRLTFRIPCELLASGLQHRIRITATDPSGASSRLVIPFRPFSAT